MSDLTRNLFESLVRSHAYGLDVYVRALHGAAASSEVDEVIQETLITAWRRLADYDAKRPFGPWLRGIARRVALDRRSKGSRDVALTADALEELESRVAAFESLRAVDADGRLAHVSDCVRALPERMRLAVELRYGSDGSTARVVEGLGGTREAARKVLERARARILECVNLKAVQGEGQA